MKNVLETNEVCTNDQRCNLESNVVVFVFLDIFGLSYSCNKRNRNTKRIIKSGIFGKED